MRHCRLPVYMLALLGSAPLLAQQAPVPGEAKKPRTVALEAGAKVLQSNTPLKPFDVYLNGFHPMKDQPEMQMESHHYCHQVNEDFAQCTLFDSSARNARLHGIEYIISEKLFQTLPAQERAFWHPHNGEILSGQLIAPGIPAPVEKALMRAKMNSYGKTWHVWNTGHEGMAADQLPLGPPKLAWSFSRDGEAIAAMARPLPPWSRSATGVSASARPSAASSAPIWRSWRGRSPVWTI